MSERQEVVLKSYYVNEQEQDNGDHEVHEFGCQFMPSEDHAVYLGNFDGCQAAVAFAKTTYPTANGCFFCCNKCNTQ